MGFGICLSLLLASSPPFPAPKVVSYSDTLKSDTGTVASFDSAAERLVVTTAAGPVTYLVHGAQLVDKEGKPAGAPSGLAAGQRVRLYYTIADGARVLEIDLE